MDKKLLFTSIVALGVVAPAFGATTIDTFPDPDAISPGQMLEDRIYTNAAIYDNMGVYDGAVNAEAEFEDDAIALLPGEYLAGGSDSATATACPAGSYCPGSVDSVVNDGNDHGIIQCPTEYNNSDSGASSILQCYKTCNVADFPHASAVSNGYYAFGAESCAATSCDSGWHLADVASVDSSYDSCGVNSGVYPYSAMDSWTCSPSVSSGTDSSVDSGTSVNSGVPSSVGDGVIPGRWSVGYSNYALRGMARLSSTSGYEATLSSDPSTTTTSNLGVEGSGGHCWCNIVGYRSAESQWYAVASSPWTYAGSVSADSNAIGRCAALCVNFMGNTGEKQIRFRRTIRGEGSLVKRICSPNTITINWSDTTSAAINANHAGTALYGGAIRTPVSVTVPAGKKFKGWRFSPGASSGN